MCLQQTKENAVVCSSRDVRSKRLYSIFVKTEYLESAGEDAQVGDSANGGKCKELKTVVIFLH